MSEGEILRDLKLEKSESFGESRLYRRVFSLADALASAPAPRAVLPQIDLKSPKIPRRLTTEWFARRVQGRHDTCMNRAAS